MIPKAERLARFIKALDHAPAVSTAEDALRLVEVLLNRIEDELSGVPNNPESWLSDDRMYPPRPDSARDVAERPDLTRYRSARHNTWIGANGAIRICRTTGECLLDKPGADGISIGQL